MKIEININKNKLSDVQISDLLQDLNELKKEQLISIINGKIFEFEIGESGFGGRVLVKIKSQINK
jgi:phosphoribosylformylglycinamidine (FGAM) synthase PurS component